MKHPNIASFSTPHTEYILGRKVKRGRISVPTRCRLTDSYWYRFWRPGRRDNLYAEAELGSAQIVDCSKAGKNFVRV
jgi:hypothetical protein